MWGMLECLWGNSMIFQILKRFWILLPVAGIGLLMVLTSLNPSVSIFFSSVPCFVEVYDGVHFPAICFLHLWGMLHLPLPHGEWKFVQMMPVAVAVQWSFILLIMMVAQLCRWAIELSLNCKTEVGSKTEKESREKH